MWYVVVGNIGTVLSTDDETEARGCYASYCEDSTVGHGRARGECVILMRDDDIVAEIAPPFRY